MKIEIELRPCLVWNTKSDGKRHSKKALFHRWVEYDDKFDIWNKVKCRAIVEYEDGTIDDVCPSNVQFLDPRHSEYVFGKEEDRENTL